jgi:hypothetical protein
MDGRIQDQADVRCAPAFIDPDLTVGCRHTAYRQLLTGSILHRGAAKALGELQLISVFADLLGLILDAGGFRLAAALCTVPICSKPNDHWGFVADPHQRVTFLRAYAVPPVVGPGPAWRLVQSGIS